MTTRFGKYEVVEALGRGGFGQVHAARDLELGRDVALKRLRTEHTADAWVVTRFLQEARAAARIAHPNVVEIFDAGVVDGIPFIAMERLAGMTLAERIASGDRLDAIAIARQLVAALRAAHDLGVIHRDLKPDNVFVLPDGRIKLLDFGFAKLADDASRTSTQMIFGTPRYMSPEQAASSKYVDHRSDIYSLGCIVYELACGVPPFTGDIAELFAQHKSARPRSPREIDPTIPVSLERLILWMLEKAPEDRPASMAIVARSLDPQLPTVAAAASIASPRASSRTAARAFALSAIAFTLSAIATAATYRTIRGPIMPMMAPEAAAMKQPADEIRVTLVATTPTMMPEMAHTADEIRELEIECLRAVTARAWTEVEMCGANLAKLDTTRGNAFIERGMNERDAAADLRTLNQALAQRDRRAAQAAYEMIDRDSVYHREAATKVARVKSPVRVAPRSVRMDEPTPAVPNQQVRRIPLSTVLLERAFAERM